MIIEKIIQDFATSVAELPFVTKSGGLVREVIINQAGNKVQRLPAALCAPFSAQSQLAHLTPDDSESCIVWFHAEPSKVITQSSVWMQMQADVVMVVWLNTRRIQQADTMAAEINIINKVCTTKADAPVNTLAVAYKGDAIPPQWDFDEKNTQMTMPPYRFIAHKFTVTYAVSLQCPAPVAQTEPTC